MKAVEKGVNAQGRSFAFGWNEALEKGMLSNSEASHFQIDHCNDMRKCNFM